MTRSPSEQVERLADGSTRYRFVVHSAKGQPPTYSYIDHLTDEVLVGRAPSIAAALAQVTERHQSDTEQ